jgi:cyanuric acid amidohydrolase
MRADVHRFSLADPNDVSGLRKALDLGVIDPTTIVAVIGKTHGNGLVNDYTRGYLTLSLSLLIGEQLGDSAEAVRARIPFVFSGGVEGVLSPHYTVFTAVPEDEPQAGKSLAIGVAFTAPMRAADVGRQTQIDAVAEAVSRARQQAGIAAADVHFVQVKGPAFTLADILEDQAAGRAVATDNPGKLMSFGRAACALGVGSALGEIPAETAVEAAVLKDFALYSSVASISAGVEVRCNEVIVIGMSPHWSGPLAIEHGTMADALDVGSLHALVQRLGFPGAAQVADADRIRAAFVKCEAPRDGMVRGRPHTMLNDGDINEQRHIRAAVGAIVASILGDTGLFVSGGAEHQGPDGGGMVAVIAERAGP